MRITRERAALIVAVFLAPSCDSSYPTEIGNPAGDAVRGQFAFIDSCAGCHASNDGLDLATFRFTDTTIIRRAVKHVDTTTARDIVAHIRTLHPQELNEETRLFQPGGGLLTSDVDFATNLFGADAFPAAMTTAGMLALNPRQIAVAVKLPVWSDEKANLDWMPDDPLPAAILDDQGSFARGAIAGYHGAPTRDNLIRGQRVAHRGPARREPERTVSRGLARRLHAVLPGAAVDVVAGGAASAALRHERPAGPRAARCLVGCRQRGAPLDSQQRVRHGERQTELGGVDVPELELCPAAARERLHGRRPQ
jgi:hypothetical protein